MRHRRHQLIMVACGTLAVVGSVLGATAPAQAHNYLVSSTPAEASTLSELPDEFVITTNDNLLDTGGITAAFALQVRDADGNYYGDGCVTVYGPGMSATPALGAPGTYTVLWQVVSADGHTVSDDFDFDWAPTTDFELVVGSDKSPTCGGGESDPPRDVDDSAPEVPAESISSDIWWIGGGLLAVGAGIGITLVIVRRPRH